MFIVKDVKFSGVMTFRTFFQVTSILHISYISDNKYRPYQKHAYPLDVDTYRILQVF